MKGYTHILWDFNGTLLDDLTPSIVCANRLLRAHGLPPFSSVEDYRAAFGFPIIDYYRRIGFDFSKYSYDEIAVEWVGYYREETKNVTLVKEALPTLEGFRRAGLSQLILSATHKDLLREQAAALGIEEFFEELLALDNIHAHSKIEVGTEWRRRNPNARPIMLGDTLHDAETARAIGADCILVAIGHQNRATLERASCLCVCDSLPEAAERILGN